jgi:hypothetical protein
MKRLPTCRKTDCRMKRLRTCRKTDYRKKRMTNDVLCLRNGVLVVFAAGVEDVCGQFGTHWHLVLANHESRDPLTE